MYNKIEELTVATALITGASGGVGAEIAKILANKKYDLILVARSKEKLEILVKDLSENFGIKTHVFIADLTEHGMAEKVFNFCKSGNITVDLLINNAGMGLFGESVSLKNADKLIQLNITALTELCAIFGKEMKNNRSGNILNIGSLVGNQPTAYFASYAASKSYVLMYSLALRHELAAFGVNVTCVQPGYIRTDFDNAALITSEKYKKFSYKNGMTAHAVASIAVKSALSHRSYVRAGIMNKILAFFQGLIPKNFLAWALSKSIRDLAEIKVE